MELGKGSWVGFEKKPPPKKNVCAVGGFAESPGFAGLFPGPLLPLGSFFPWKILFVLAWNGGKNHDIQSV